MKTAVVIGATGLVGSHLVDLLLQDNRFDKVKIFIRRTTGITNSKLEEHIINFDDTDTWQNKVTGDVLFSALGTTIRQAGSQPAQYKIDYTYQYNFAKTAAQNGIRTYVLISSAGASAQSRLFYSRMKGELEEAIIKLSFSHIHIIQPGILTGPRKENRLGEKVGIAVLSVLHRVPGLHKYKPIHAGLVARAMINASFDESKVLKTHTLQDVFDLAEKPIS
jgi:uncharacterized protein YbjT (DUF2867 family)